MNGPLRQPDDDIANSMAPRTRIGIPSEAEYLAAYCRRRGIDGMPGYDFYIAFNFFRMAAIFHGIKGRVLRGTASSAQARERVAVLPELMALAWAQAEHAVGSAATW